MEFGMRFASEFVPVVGYFYCDHLCFRGLRRIAPW